MKRSIHFRFLNRISLFYKLLLLFIVGVILPFSVQTFLYAKQIGNNVEKSVSQKLEMALVEKADKLEGYLSGAMSLARIYGKQESLYQYVDYTYENELDYLEIYQNEISKTFEGNVPYYLQVKDSIIYTDNPTVFSGTYICQMDKLNINEEEIVKFMKEGVEDYSITSMGAKGGQFYFRIARETDKLIASQDRCLSIFYPMNYYPQFDRYNKILRLNMNLPYLSNVLSENNMFDNMLVTDLDGRVLLSVHSYSQYGEFDYFNRGEAEKNAYIVEQQVGDFPIILYGIYQTDTLREELIHNFQKSIAIGFCGLVISILCIMVIIGNITGRIKKVVEQSERVADGNFVINEYDAGGRDEISTLEKSMNQMSERLNDLIQKEYRSEILRAELEQETANAKLLALQSQVNPHFMFNALESIRLKAASKGETETAQMIKYMSKMFRKLISWDDNIITVEDEIHFLDEFLHIQKYRFGDEFTYEIDVEKEAFVCMIPKMVVQQLVENACVHGVEAVTHERIVSVKVRLTRENMLEVMVQDNGGGMTDEKLEQLSNMIKNGKNTGKSVGLYNVYRRLKLYYGSTFEFHIKSKLGEGTLCIIRIPSYYEENGEGKVCIQ